MSGEDRRNFASNNPYGEEYQRQWSQQARGGRPARGGGPIDFETAQQLMAAEAERYRQRTEPAPVQQEPAQQESTLPGYRTTANTWERPSDTWVAAADQDAQNQLRAWEREQGRGTPTEENPNQWDYETMDAAQAAAAAAAAGTWQQQQAPAQTPTYSQSYQFDQSQGYAGGTTLSPEQAAYFSQQVRQYQPFSADPPQVDPATQEANQQAYNQSLALSAAHYPGNDFQGQYQSQDNPVAGPARDSLAPLDRRTARGTSSTNPHDTGLGRRGAVRRSTTRHGHGGRGSVG